MLRKLIAVFPLLVFALGAAWAQHPLQVADDKIAALQAVSGQTVDSWRYMPEDLPHGQDPALDDSSWEKSDVVEFTWGAQPTAWMRTVVTVPDQVAGVPVSGTSVTFRCGVDDDGILYVNGKEAQRFHWGEGGALLTDHARPGEKFSIAIKGLNTGGPGRLLWARLEFGAFSDVSGSVSGFVEKYQRARSLYDAVDAKRREPYLPIIQQAVDSVDVGLLRDGKREEFFAALKAAGAELERIDEVATGLTAYLVGHAHIDMNWLWLWPETIDVCKNTFTSACDFMDAYPDFRFGQSQAVVYKTMQQTHPEVFERIKQAIRRGQWDPIATNWTEGDNNMSSGEAIVRSILYGKRYMKKQFGTESVVGWEPDTFGHPWTLPQILAKSGIRYYYFCRANSSGKPLFWWQGPDGSKVLAFSFEGYNGDISEDGVLNGALRFTQMTGVPDYMRVYGVGDHGGGPTRQMIETAKMLQARSNYPRIKFAEASDYYETVLKAKQDLPAYCGELNPEFQGCYTTHSDIKRWNRACESILPCAEKFASIASQWGTRYPLTDFEQSWRKTCFNQFHDILCGSAIHGSYEYSDKLGQEVVSQAGAALGKSLSSLSAKIDTRGPGIPVVVFNPLSWRRTDTVEVDTPFPGETTGVTMTDAAGTRCSGTSIGGGLRFTARDVPALGYKVFWANRAKTPAKPGATAEGKVIENQFLRVSVDAERGTIRSIYDKTNRREVIAAGGDAALLQILMEEPHGMSAWNIGRIVDSKDLAGECEVAVTQSGPERATVTIDREYGDSKFAEEISLYDSVPRVDVRVTADWQEVGSASKPSPMLKIAFPVNVAKGSAAFEIPFGSVQRPTDGAEVVAQKWIDLSGSGYGVSLLNDCKYGFDVNGNVMRASLLRSSYDPDPTPDQGTHEMTFSLYPHAGDWRSAGTTKLGYEINEPLVARVVSKHAGSLPKSMSFLSVSARNVVVTAVKRAEDNDGWIVRFYETDGKACRAKLRIGIPAKYVVETDLMERPIGKKMALSKGSFTASVGKHEIKTYKLLAR